MSKHVNDYISLFTKLKRAHQFGGAPHKPILLLSVLDAIEKRFIQSERIYITPELIALFRSNWKIWVKTPHTMNFALPFFHLQNEPFWKIVIKPNVTLSLTSKHSIKSFSSLTQEVDYAEIDKELFILITNDVDREIMRRAILEKYFSQVNTSNYSSTYYLDEVAEQILKDSAVQYKKKIDRLKETENQENFEEEIYIRSSVFKKEIPKIYNHTCCMSGLKVQINNNHTLIEACHIKPFAQEHDDTIGNGIALCPNLHTAFDKGLITISNDYRIVVSSRFIENDSHYSIKKLDNKKIILPYNNLFYPRKEVLEWHRDTVFEKWV